MSDNRLRRSAPSQDRAIDTLDNRAMRYGFSRASGDDDDTFRDGAGPFATRNDDGTLEGLDTIVDDLTRKILESCLGSDGRLHKLPKLECVLRTEVGPLATINTLLFSSDRRKIFDVKGVARAHHHFLSDLAREAREAGDRFPDSDSYITFGVNFGQEERQHLRTHALFPGSAPMSAWEFFDRAGNWADQHMEDIVESWWDLGNGARRRDGRVAIPRLAREFVAAIENGDVVNLR